MHSNITIHGKEYSADTISLLKNHENPFIRTELYDFLEEWFSESPAVSVQSSGSTGIPKIMQAEKSRMIASAEMTCNFLGLKKNDSALLCMPLKYIGAKMVAVRAIVRNLNLLCAEPSMNPLQHLDAAPNFLAMTPAQVHAGLQNPKEKALLQNTEHLIIGGSAVNTALAEELEQFPHHVWSTYGMTETLSHIALRRLNGKNKSDWYQPFEGVTISLSHEQTLVIHAPKVCPDVLTTNDIAEIDNNGRFKILGRKDNIINSGGIKLQIEKIEEQLSSVLPFPFQVTSLPHERFGEIPVLLVQGEQDFPFQEKFQNVPDKYARPKHVFFVKELPKTETDKPNRAKAKEIALQCQKENLI